MLELSMELRDVQAPERIISGVCAPYGEVTRLIRSGGGERLLAGAFSRTIRHRGNRIPLFRNHEHDMALGVSRRFIDGPDELVGEFRVNDGPAGDRLLEDVERGYLPGLSVGFMPLDTDRDGDGITEVREAQLVEVSMVGLPAYAGAGLLAVRQAQDLDALLAPFRVPRPDVDLSPIPPIWSR